jgi:fermentation-respiration switch protein FrsA (DUF1100 family)
MARRMGLTTVFAIAVLALAACGSGGTSHAARVPAATETTQAAPTATLTPVPTLTLTSTRSPTPTSSPTATPTNTPSPTPTATPTPLNPLAIERMRQGSYPGSDIVIEQTLAPGSNYQRYIASYRSEGLKIYALLTVPDGEKPATGWPVIIFNHGYIPPKQYRTTDRYVAYVDALARSGYIVFRPDYRGNGSSEGEPGSPYSSPDYTVDVLNAVGSMKRYSNADPNRIGMWGHSMGGGITLRAMVVSKDIKAGVIWAGVVGTYSDLLNRWHPTSADSSSAPPEARHWREDLVKAYGTPETNPEFWNSISPNAYLADLSGPVQLHHGTADENVPIAFSDELAQQIQAAGKQVEYYRYQGDNHNISKNFTTAMQRSIQFFDKYVKNRP